MWPWRALPKAIAMTTLHGLAQVGFLDIQGIRTYTGIRNVWSVGRATAEHFCFSIKLNVYFQPCYELEIHMLFTPALL